MAKTIPPSAGSVNGESCVRVARDAHNARAEALRCLSLEPLSAGKYNAENKEFSFQQYALMMKCPICDKPTVWKDNPFRPFCSERCKLIDFGNWADENYAVPAENAPTSGEAIERYPSETNDEETRYS